MTQDVSVTNFGIYTPPTKTSILQRIREQTLGAVGEWLEKKGRSNRSSQNCDYAAGIDSVKENIKEHFGIEE